MGFEVGDSTVKPNSSERASASLYNAISPSDWNAVSKPNNKPGEPTSGSLSLDGDIYGRNLSDITTSLTADAKALSHAAKGSTEYNKDLNKLDQDEKTLHTDVFALLKNSSSYSDFANVMNADHAALKGVADTLDKMGLKQEASDTTAYFPLSHYEKYFSGSGGGGGGGSGGGGGGGDTGYPIKPPSGSTEYSNLDTASGQHVNLIASEIGGDGDVVSASATQEGANKVAFSETSGKYGDALWRTDNNTKQAADVKDVQLNATFSLTADQLKNTAEIEKDIVIQKPDGTFGLLGTQINTKTGEVDFWNQQTGHWVNEGKLGPLEANKEYNLQIGGSINDTGNPNTGSYTYDYYSLNGQKLDSTQNTFGTVELKNKEGKNTPWQTGVYVQTQVDMTDLPSHLVNGKEVSDIATAGFTESNEQLFLSDS
jgi:hypothetical protein